MDALLHHDTPAVPRLAAVPAISIQDHLSPVQTARMCDHFLHSAAFAVVFGGLNGHVGVGHGGDVDQPTPGVVGVFETPVGGQVVVAVVQLNR